MLKATHCRQKGFMAIVLVVFLVVFVAIAAAIVSMTTSGARSAGDHAMASGALFIAESGIEWAARELFDADNPETDCNNLSAHAALPIAINGGGSADITESNYDAGDGSCRLTSVGTVGQTVRVLKGNIPESVLAGNAGGGDDLFDGADDKFTGCGGGGGPVTCGDGFIRFDRPSGGSGQGQPPTQADGSDLITDEFTSGDVVYFTANIEWDQSDPPLGNVFNIELTNGIADCDVALPTLTSGCSAGSGNELYDAYDIVLVLGDDFEPADVNKVRVKVDWSNSNNSNWVELTDGCIGRAGHCSGAAGDDPTEDGTWDEDP